MKKITGILFLLTLICFGGPASVFAATWQLLDPQVNQLHIEGTCNSKREVTIYLFKGSAITPIYNAGTPCVRGTFSYKDDLEKWHFPEGTYKVLVGEGQSGANFNHFEEVVIAEPIPVPLVVVPPDPDLLFINQIGALADSVQSLEQSMAKIAESLDKTTLSSPKKIAPGDMLSGVKVMARTLAVAVMKLKIFVNSPELNSDVPPADNLAPTSPAPLANSPDITSPIASPPEIAILNTPSPRVVASDADLVTYSYTVWNVGVGHNQTMTDVVVTDNNCSPITFLAGDLNNDGKLNEGENWEYSCVTTLTKTTTNTATVIGYDEDISHEAATASTTTTVVVVPEQGLVNTAPRADTEFPSNILPPPSPVPNADNVPPSDTTLPSVTAPAPDIVAPPSDTVSFTGRVLFPDTGFIPAGEFYSNTGLLRPFIHIVKITKGTTNTYIITNPSDVPIQNISVGDNVCAPITYISGDTNGNTLLGPTETWKYTCTTTSPVTERSIARVVGRANTFTPIDIFITDPGFANKGTIILVGILTLIIFILASIIFVPRWRHIFDGQIAKHKHRVIRVLRKFKK
jgi:hypothetical protein